MASFGEFVRYNGLIYEVVDTGEGTVTLQPIRSKLEPLYRLVISSQKQAFPVPLGETIEVDVDDVAVVSQGTAVAQATPFGFVNVDFVAHTMVSVRETIYINTPVDEPDDPVREHYTFDAWYTEIEFINPWDFSVGVVDDDLILYGKWIPVEYTVTYDSNDGTAVEPQDVVYPNTATEPDAPTKDSFLFDAWYIDDGAFEYPVDFATWIPLADVTIYANWNPAVTVEFDPKGGTAVEDQILLVGSLVTEPDDPTKAEFTFEGWFTDDGTFLVPWDFETDTADVDTTLYAKWESV